MMPITFTIPGDARGKGRPRATIRGKHASVYTDAKTASYENLVRLAAREAMGNQPPLGEPLVMSVSIRVTPPKSASKKATAAMLSGAIRPAKKPDITNILKAVEDGCNTVAFTDDSLIVSLFAEKHYAPTAGIDVAITQIQWRGQVQGQAA